MTCVIVCECVGAARADVARPAGEDRRVERDSVGQKGLLVCVCVCVCDT